MKYTHYYEFTDGRLREWNASTNLANLKKDADKCASPQYKGTYLPFRQIIKDAMGNVVYDVGPGSEDLKLKALNAKIEADNKAFDKLPKYKQRMEVAKDVLKWMAAEKLTMSTGTYFDITDNIASSNRATLRSGSLKDTLLSMKSCTVCAKGAIFACTVARKNEVKNGDLIEFIESDKLSETLQGLFSGHQLRMIETEFEGIDIEYANMNMLQQRKTKRIHPKMGIMSLSNAAKMTRIMKNIIRNNGWFRP